MKTTTKEEVKECQPHTHTHTGRPQGDFLPNQPYYTCRQVGGRKMYLQVKNLNSTPSGGQFKNKL
jgi:hypothetical protein